MEEYSAGSDFSGHLDVMPGRAADSTRNTGALPCDSLSQGDRAAGPGRYRTTSSMSEGLYRSLVEHLPVVSYTALLGDSPGSNYISPQAASILGYTQEELTADPDLWLRSIHPEDRATVMAEFERRRSRISIGPFRLEYRFVKANGAVIWLRDEAVFILDSSGKPRLMQGVIYDITEIKVQEEQLRESASAQAHLMEQLVTSQEAERRRIQMDIHDGPLQSLGVSLMALDRAVRRLERGEQDVARHELQHLRETLVDTVGELRAVLADLSQDVLAAHGLVPALRKQLERFSDITGIRARLEADLAGRLPPEYEMLVYRLAQESLSNIRKHSSAYNVVFSLTERERTLHFQVKDDGVGFDIDEVAHNLLQSHGGEKLGLRSMRERARILGGSCVSSPPGARALPST